MKTKLKRGMKVRVVGNSSNHNVPIGSIATLTTKQNAYGWRTAEFPHVYLGNNDIKPATQSKADIEGEIEELKAALDAAKAKLAYMKAAKTKEFDETEFKVFQALATLKSKKGDFAKAKALAKLIDG